MTNQNNQKGNEEQQQAKTNSPRRSSARMETGGPSSVPGQTRAAGATEVGGSSMVVTSAQTTPVVPARTAASGVAGGLNIAARPPTGEGSSRRRSGNADPEKSSAPKKAKAETEPPVIRQPTCSTCGRRFGSWKAMFGHLRAHPERGYRGAFPPPEACCSPEKPEEADKTNLQTQLAPTLLNLAKETLDKMKQDQGGAGPSRRRRAIDLNVEPKDSGTSSSSSPPSGGKGFDLNKPPKDDNHGKSG